MWPGHACMIWSIAIIRWVADAFVRGTMVFRGCRGLGEALPVSFAIMLPVERTSGVLCHAG